MPTWRRNLFLVLAAVLLACAAGRTALAHKTNLTTATLAVDQAEVTYRLTISAHDLAVALGIATDLTTPVPQESFEARRAALADYLAQRLRVSSDGAPCPADAPEVDYAGLPDELGVILRFVCPSAVGHLRLDYRLFFDIDPQHRSLGKLELPEGAQQFLFDRSLTSLEVDMSSAEPAPWWQRFAHIFLLGGEHILLGYDHILFLIALLIPGGGLWRIVKIVTAFTVAHSLTLGLAWYGLVEPPQRLVEILIAASIAYVAGENLLGKSSDHRWLLAGGFGLIHGLGFYAALRGLDLQGSGLLTTLLGFNLGVEAGQLLVVVVLFFPLRWWLRQDWYAPSARVASLAILLIAGWWIFDRSLLA